MRKRTLVLGSVGLVASALMAGTASAARDDLAGANDAIRKDIQEKILGIMLLAYVHSVIAAVQSGSYTADSLAVAYSNLRAIEQMTRGKSGAFWSDLRTLVARATDMVIAAYDSLPTAGDIEDHATEVEDESISPFIGKIPDLEIE